MRPGLIRKTQFVILILFITSCFSDGNTEQPASEPKVGYEILQTVSENEMKVWISTEITQSEFDGLELPQGWTKNQPRESESDGGSFSRSPNATTDGPLTEQDLFGFTWRHNATIVETGIIMDGQGLLAAASVAKHHQLTFDKNRTLYILTSPVDEQFLRVSRDAGRVNDTPTFPEGWEIVEYVTQDSLTITLPNPTLNIRSDNQDSFQGPVDIIELEFTAPLALTNDLCDDANNMTLLQESPIWRAILGSAQFNVDQIQRMAAEPTAGPFYMLNLIRFREQAIYNDGRDTDLTGVQANALYSPIEFLNAIGAGAVFNSQVDNQIDGDDFLWETVALVEYPCPVAFFAMISHPGFQERAVHKDAAVEKTIVMVTHLEPSLLPPDFEPPESPYPATDEDPSFELIHVMDFHDIAQYEEGSDEPERTGAEAWDEYEVNGAAAGVSVGSYPAARLQVQGVLVGDDRSWDEVHINHMPSMAAFQALLSDENRQENRYHRTAALSDNYSMITFPTVNDFSIVPDTETIGALPITDLGVGTVCSTDADCEGIGFCLSNGAGSGFCSRACGSGECGDPYLCCHSCSAIAAPNLPFDGSACLIGQAVSQLTAAPVSCTCD